MSPRRRLLLVEDEPDSREALASALERSGYAVLAAADAEGAIAIVEGASARESLDAAVVDVVLGDDDRGGLRVLERLRASATRPPVVMITAFADVDRVKAALNLGAAHLLEKPFRAPELARVLEGLFTVELDAGATVTRTFARAKLTPREEEVARLALKGLPSPEIGQVLGMSEKTARQHLSRVYEKCGVQSRAELFHHLFPI